MREIVRLNCTSPAGFNQYLNVSIRKPFYSEADVVASYNWLEKSILRELIFKGHVIEKYGLTVFFCSERLWAAVNPVALDCGGQNTDVVIHVLC